MEDPSSVPVVTASPAVIGGDIQDGAKPPSANRNGKKAESGSGSFFTWFIVLALLGVWTSVAVVYFDLVDYQGVVDKARSFHINLSEALQGRLVAYDADGDGDFDVDDAKVLLGLSAEGEVQAESQLLEWLHEVEEGGSDWLSGFFTFLYGLINPMESLEEDELGETDMQDEDEDDELPVHRERKEEEKDGNPGQKIIIVGLHNQ
uniref:Aspartyl beta-hydroxylase/Triadin domain-containing protein n=1 Tax=Gouania willdenowi TaxID=441366 RepID=A0A8C5GH34_GOUWI